VAKHSCGQNGVEQRRIHEKDRGYQPSQFARLVVTSLAAASNIDDRHCERYKAYYEHNRKKSHNRHWDDVTCNVRCHAGRRGFVCEAVLYVSNGPKCARNGLQEVAVHALVVVIKFSRSE